MNNKKIAFPFRTSQKLIDNIDSLLEKANCQSRNEFVNKAISFYISYISVSKHPELISNSIYNMLIKCIEEDEDRRRSNLFKLSLESSIVMNILAKSLRVSPEYIKDLRKKCEEELKTFYTEHPDSEIMKDLEV